MTITISGIAFDHCHYDDRGDVLYLSVGPSREPAEAFETAEGHNVEYDEHGSVIGLVLLNVRWTLQREGELKLTWPPAHLLARDLEAALAA
ncbi:MAG TPA: DUF2283 domain-containing protein [Solirubrobacteraceae bacterium]|nr:DUF2283 domain-containing protein [Solirubrobacteraceae bacterium]